MRILVVGGAGYIGSHTCKILAKAGHTPITFDSLVYGHDWAVQWGPFIKGDILDRAALEKVFTEHKPDAVIHFAAFSLVGESVTEPQKYYHNNFVGTLTLLDVMRSFDVKKIVFSSTCATYGIPENIPITEQTPQSPINPYGRSKLMIEQVLQDYQSAYDLRPIYLRYFNAAGADPDGEIGEEHDPETHLIPLTLQAAAGIREKIVIFGTDYDTEDGTCIRDYTHVNDLATAHVLAVEALDDISKLGAYNVGTGQGISVQEIINSSQEITGRSINTELGERRAGDPPILVADPSLIKSKLGWQPECSDINTLISTAWNWIEKSSKR